MIEIHAVAVIQSLLTLFLYSILHSLYVRVKIWMIAIVYGEFDKILRRFLSQRQIKISCFKHSTSNDWSESGWEWSLRLVKIVMFLCTMVLMSTDSKPISSSWSVATQVLIPSSRTKIPVPRTIFLLSSHTLFWILQRNVYWNPAAAFTNILVNFRDSSGCSFMKVVGLVQIIINLNFLFLTVRTET